MPRANHFAADAVGKDCVFGLPYRLPDLLRTYYPETMIASTSQIKVCHTKICDVLFWSKFGRPGVYSSVIFFWTKNKISRQDSDNDPEMLSLAPGSQAPASGDCFKRFEINGTPCNLIKFTQWPSLAAFALATRLVGCRSSVCSLRWVPFIRYYLRLSSRPLTHSSLTHDISCASSFLCFSVSLASSISYFVFSSAKFPFARDSNKVKLSNTWENSSGVVHSR